MNAHCSFGWSGADLSPLPHESTLSALWRFQWRNALSASQLKRVSTGRPLRQEGDSLVHLDRILPEFLTKLDWKLPTAEETLLKDRLGLSLTGWISDRLRYCPICLEAGFHSIWHQFTPLVQCPLHGCSIQETCHACGEVLEKYRFSRTLFRRPYCCFHCGNPICGVKADLMTHLEFRTQFREIEIIFRPFVRWLGEAHPGIGMANSAIRHIGSYFAWSSWCEPRDLIRSLVFSSLPLRDSMRRPTYRTITILTWRVRMQLIVDPLSGRRTPHRWEQMRTAHNVYRATLRGIRHWIYQGRLVVTSDEEREIYRMLQGDVIYLTHPNPALLGFMLMRMFLENRMPLHIQGAEVGDYIPFPVPSVEHRTPRLAWRAGFLGYYIGWLHLIFQIRRKGAIAVSELHGLMHDLVAGYANVEPTDAESSKCVVRGAVFFPTIGGLPLRPFRRIRHSAC